MYSGYLSRDLAAMIVNVHDGLLLTFYVAHVAGLVVVAQECSQRMLAPEIITAICIVDRGVVGAAPLFSVAPTE